MSGVDSSSMVGGVPVDAAVASAYAIGVGAAVVAGVVDGPLRTLLTVPLIGFLPGYAVLSALFPTSKPAEDGRAAAWRRPAASGLGWVERCSLSVGASLALLPPLVVLLTLGGATFTTITVTTALVALVVTGSAAGVVRRLRLSAEDRYAVPTARWRAEAGSVVGRESGRGHGDRALDVLLSIAVVVAVAGLAVGLAAPADGESYTEVSVLTPGSDGPVAGDYPETVRAGEPAELVVAVENELGTAAEYEVVIALDRVRRSDSGRSLTVLERSELSRFDLSAADGERVTRRTSPRPDLVGGDLRLNVFVYRGDAPESPSSDSALEHLYVWLDVRQ